MPAELTALRAGSMGQAASFDGALSRHPAADQKSIHQNRTRTKARHQTGLFFWNDASGAGRGTQAPGPFFCSITRYQQSTRVANTRE